LPAPETGDLLAEYFWPENVAQNPALDVPASLKHFEMITDAELGTYSIVGGFVVMFLILVYHYTTAPSSALHAD
jgi:Oligosaccaryltransferase